MIDTDDLKALAEHMDYKDVNVVREHVWYNHNESDLAKAKIYYPLTDNDQLVELIEKLKMSVMHEPNIKNCWYAYIQFTDIHASSNKYAEAVVKTAIEAIK